MLSCNVFVTLPKVQIKFYRRMVEKKFITAKEAAEYLGVTKNALYIMVMRQNIPVHRPTGRRLLFKIDELDAWIVRSTVNNMEG